VKSAPVKYVGNIAKMSNFEQIAGRSCRHISRPAGYTYCSMGGNGKTRDEKARPILKRTMTTQYDKVADDDLRTAAEPRKGESHDVRLYPIMLRIAWCRLQEQLYSITKDERAGWRAEEAGLVDALGCRDRIAFMREEHRSQFIRYQCGLEAGRALLRLNTLLPWGMTPKKGLGPIPLTTPAWVNRRPSQAPSPVHVGESRR
jgi:hypothetical protein